ncbi:hypothetical protein DMENIID0001_135970 [Sergentomyia squamirostris]
MSESTINKSVYWKTMGSAFSEMLSGGRFVDVTLVCEGHRIQCHRIVLAACSHFFEDLLKDLPAGQYPVIILPRDVKYWMIQALLEFMYHGEVNVAEDGIDELGKCAEILQIRCLKENLKLFNSAKTGKINPVSQPDPDELKIKEELLIPLETDSQPSASNIETPIESSGHSSSFSPMEIEPSVSFQQKLPPLTANPDSDQVNQEDFEQISDSSESQNPLENFELLSKRKPRNYAKKDMEKALLSIQNGMSVFQAEIKYNIARCTLYKYMKLYNIKSSHPQRSSIKEKIP